MGDGVEESVLAFIAADFADDENGVHDEAGDDDAEENDAENERDDATPVVDDPAYVEKNREGDQACA